MGDGGAGAQGDERGRSAEERRAAEAQRRGVVRWGGSVGGGEKHGTLVWGLEMWGRIRERVVNGGEGRAGWEEDGRREREGVRVTGGRKGGKGGIIRTLARLVSSVRLELNTSGAVAVCDPNFPLYRRRA